MSANTLLCKGFEHLWILAPVEVSLNQSPAETKELYQEVEDTKLNEFYCKLEQEVTQGKNILLFEYLLYFFAWGLLLL